MRGLIIISFTGLVLPVMVLLNAMPVYADSHFGATDDNNQGRAYRDNPWAVPRPPENPLDFQRLPKYRSQQYRPENTDRYGRANRFVTPEILDSIKQQQTRSQLMYSSPYYQQPAVRPGRLPAYGGGYYPAPLPGATYANPLYDVPPVSPWGSTPDLLYQGQAYPLVPNEAIGGLPPMPLYNTTPGMMDNFFDPLGFSQGMYGY